jgi:DNA helicase IV
MEAATAAVVDTTVQAMAATSAPKSESLGDRLAAAAAARAAESAQRTQEQALAAARQTVNIAAVGITSAIGQQVVAEEYEARAEEQARQFFASMSPEDREPGGDDEPLGG